MPAQLSSLLGDLGPISRIDFTCGENRGQWEGQDRMFMYAILRFLEEGWAEHLQIMISIQYLYMVLEKHFVLRLLQVKY